MTRRRGPRPAGAGWRKILLPGTLVAVLVVARSLLRRPEKPAAEPSANTDNSNASPASTPVESGSSLGHLAAQLIGSASVLTAVLVYMGWAYEQSYLSPFHVSALSVGVSVPQYVLKSMNVFLERNVFFGAAAIAAITGAGIHVYRRFPNVTAATASVSRNGLAMSSAVVLIIGLAWLGQGPWPAVTSWFAHYNDAYYALLGLLGLSLLLLTRPERGRRYQFPFIWALIVAAGCVLWAAGEYASTLGAADARDFYRSAQTSATVYSTQLPALNGPGVSCTPIPGAPATAAFRYRCTGLDLLYNESGTTYYLVPARPGPDGPAQTYILSDSDQIMITLSAQ